MKMTRQQIIEKAKEFARKNYNKGYDVFVECYGQKEWEEFVSFDGEDLTWKEIKEDMKNMASVWNERRADAANSTF